MDFYHVLNRGVEKRNVVRNNDDRNRFVQSLYLFNNRDPVHIATIGKKAERDLLVHIHAWCLMNNHYHLLLSPVDDDVENISLFLKKLNGGYAKFFNEKYNRSGYLWQGKTKKILINNDAHFLYIPYYIHLNPLDYTHKQWREGLVADHKDAMCRLAEYRWSSLQDYQQKHNFPSILSQTVLSKILGTHSEQSRNIKRILKSPDLFSDDAYMD